MTVKLDPEMERELRRRSAELGLPASAVMRDALSAWLAAHPRPAASPYALGEDLFGKYAGSGEGSGSLADDRKDAFAEVAAERHARRGAGRA